MFERGESSSWSRHGRHGVAKLGVKERTIEHDASGMWGFRMLRIFDHSRLVIAPRWTSWFQFIMYIFIYVFACTVCLIDLLTCFEDETSWNSWLVCSIDVHGA